MTVIGQYRHWGYDICDYNVPNLRVLDFTMASSLVLDERVITIFDAYVGTKDKYHGIVANLRGRPVVSFRNVLGKTGNVAELREKGILISTHNL